MGSHLSWTCVPKIKALCRYIYELCVFRYSINCQAHYIWFNFRAYSLLFAKLKCSYLIYMQIWIFNVKISEKTIINSKMVWNFSFRDFVFFQKGELNFCYLSELPSLLKIKCISNLFSLSLQIHSEQSLVFFRHDFRSLYQLRSNLQLNIWFKNVFILKNSVYQCSIVFSLSIGVYGIFISSNLTYL